MASHLCRTQAILQIPRYVPALIARTQTTQTTPTAGKGIPPAGNFNSAIPPSSSSNTTGSKNTPPIGGSAANQSFMSSPAGKVGAVAVLSIAIYAGYKMMSGNKEDSKDKKDAKNKKDQKDSKDKGDQNKKDGADKQANNAKDHSAKK